MTCPACGNALTLGESRVRIREDGTLAHVKCDARPSVSQPARKAVQAVAPVRPAPIPGLADGRPVAVVWRHLDPFRYEVTDQSGEVVWAGPSGTLLGQWKRTRPDLQIVTAAALYGAVRSAAGHPGPTTDPEYGKLGSTKQKRQRRGQEH